MRLAKRFLLIGLVLSLLTPGAIAQAPPSPTDKPVKPAPPPRPNPVKLRAALDRNDLEDAVRQIEAGWKQQYEEYFQRQPVAQPSPVQGISRRLALNAQITGKNTALIYAVPTPKALELIVIPPDGKPFHKRISDANIKTLPPQIQAFRSGILNPQSQTKDYLPAAQQLYKWMIAPLEGELRSRKIDSLIFCMGARLRSTPLAALHDGKQFLAEKYSISIIPAFSLMHQVPPKIRNTRILAMGASQFQDLAPLPAVPLEISTIANSLWKGEELLNQEFTLANLKEERSKYPYGILHLATHAEFSPGAVNESYIQFWDQRLKLNQVQSMNLSRPQVQLLVLSACRTALGDTQAELGFAGFAVQSGSQAAIASLWSVNDVGTLVLMTEFYRHLRSAPIKAEALRQAQVALLKRQVNLKTSMAMRSGSSNRFPAELARMGQADLSHPYYWAAFTVIGNPW